MVASAARIKGRKVITHMCSQKICENFTEQIGLSFIRIALLKPAP